MSGDQGEHQEPVELARLCAGLAQSANPERRRDAALLLASLSDGERLSLLAKDEDASVRTAAVASLSRVDLPQAVDAAGNNHAPRMLLRDVDNLRRFFGRAAPELLATQYGPEIWDLYARGMLHPATALTTRVRAFSR